MEIFFVKGSILAQDLKTKPQHKGDLFTPEGQRTGITDKMTGKRGKEQGKGSRVFGPEEQRRQRRERCGP